jgi:hypothetical protein
MIGPTGYQKRYGSARQRLLQESIEVFFKREFPRHFGPVVRRSIAQELVELIEAQLPPREFVRPGQCVWNAVSKDTRPDHPARRLVPVVLTLVAEDDINQLVEKGSVKQMAANAVARMLQEAYEQGALLSMRDIGLLVGRHSSHISALRKTWETSQDQLLPHPGNLQDFGSCISHKVTIIQKVLGEKKDPLRVARETRHSQRAVDRYLKDFHRVRTTYEHNKDLEFVSFTTGLSPHLVQQYVRIIKTLNKTP